MSIGSQVSWHLREGAQAPWALQQPQDNQDLNLQAAQAPLQPGQTPQMAPQAQPAPQIAPASAPLGAQPPAIPQAQTPAAMPAASKTALPRRPDADLYISPKVEADFLYSFIAYLIRQGFTVSRFDNEHSFDPNDVILLGKDEEGASYPRSHSVSGKRELWEFMKKQFKGTKL